MLESGAKVYIRKSCPADARALATVFAHSWEQAYLGIIPRLHLQSIIAKRGLNWWRRALRHAEGTMIIEVNGTVAGYATSGTSRSRGKYQGEIYELYLDPDYQGIGFGERLFEATRHDLDMRQLRGMVVWALLDNTRACDFYWRRGGRPIAESTDRFGRTELPKIAFGWL